MVAAGLLNGDIPTVTGKTLRENIESFPSLPQDQAIIRPLNNPIKKTGHIEILRGNLAPLGAVAKITGKEGLLFKGKALVFNKEHELDAALNAGTIPRGENVVVVVRYEGPKGGPGSMETLIDETITFWLTFFHSARATQGFRCHYGCETNQYRTHHRRSILRRKPRIHCRSYLSRGSGRRTCSRGPEWRHDYD